MTCQRYSILLFKRFVAMSGLVNGADCASDVTSEHLCKLNKQASEHQCKLNKQAREMKPNEALFGGQTRRNASPIFIIEGTRKSSSSRMPKITSKRRGKSLRAPACTVAEIQCNPSLIAANTKQCLNLKHPFRKSKPWYDKSCI